jgi:hypothetical protein
MGGGREQKSSISQGRDADYSVRPYAGTDAKKEDERNSLAGTRPATSEVAMPTDVTFLIDELGDQKESWKIDHDELKGCWELEDLLRRGIGWFHLIRMADDSWSKKVQRGSVEFDAKIARRLHGWYRWWLLPCDRVLAELEKHELKYKVEGAEQFRDCIRLANRSASIDVEHLIESVSQEKAGRAVPLTEGLWDAIIGDNAGGAEGHPIGFGCPNT